MKKITLVVLLLTATTISTAQQLYVEGGKTSSYFDYRNSQGEDLQNLHQTNHNFMAFGYRGRVITNKEIMGSIGVRYAGYGAIGSDNSLGNFMEWNVDYLEFTMGLDHKLFSIKKGAIYVKGATSLGFMVQGSQTLNNTVLDLKKAEEFDQPLIDFRLGAGFSHPISENLSFYVQYMYGKSVVWASKPEKLRIESNNIGFGLLIDISKKQEKQEN